MASKKPATEKSGSPGSQPAARQKNLTPAPKTANTTGSEAAEDAVQISHEDIERRVEERTAELVRVNEDLRREITGRKRAEEKLRESENRFRELFENMESGVAVYRVIDDGEDFILTDFNRGGEKIEGMNREDIIGKRVTEVFPGVKDFGLFDVFQKVWRTGKPEYHPVSFYEDEGLAGWRENRVYKLPSGEIVAIYEDKTEQKQAEGALAEERRLGELLLDSLPHPAMLIRRDRTILAANKTARDAGAKIGGLCWQEFGHTDYIPEEDKQYLCQHAAPPSGGTRCTFCLADESLSCGEPADNPRVHAFGRIWHTHWTPLDDDVYLHYAIDMTDHIQTETELRQSEVLRAEAEKLAAAGRMAARVAHEIGNPLAGVKAAFQVVKKAIPEDYPRYKHVGRIEKEIERIEQIVRQMIHLHRAEREAESDVSIRETVGDVVAMLQPICRKYGVSIEVDTESCRDVVKLPENGLRQVLYALLVNGIEASPKGNVIRIEAVLNQRAVRITVADEGGGVPKQHEHRIFDPFFTTKGPEVTGGLGLGLPIAKGIVEAWGGTLDFESQPEQGCVFRLVLPRGDADESPDSDPPGSNPDCG